MSDAIVVALISLLGVVVTAAWQNKRISSDLERQSDLADARLEKAQAVTDTKLAELTREVREHNNFARRVPIIEAQLEGLEKRMTKIEK